jgi:putative membrane protein
MMSHGLNVKESVTPGYFRFPLCLLAVLLILCVVTGYDPPAGFLNWFLEVSPGLAGIVVLALTARRFPMSHLVYLGCFIHMLVLIYGGFYTYAETPLGNWARDAFAFSRNHYDRVGHVALGLFPALVARELLLRQTALQRGGWLNFIVVSIVLAVGAFWELLEWWVTLMVAPEVGQAYLGLQGDIWDAQWDMFLAMIGGIASLILFSRLHDRSMSKMPFA